MGTYLITGVAGFIGCNLARALLAQGHTVGGLDDFSSGKRSNLKDLDGLRLWEGDIGDAAVCRDAMQGVDYVLHHAAVASVPQSVAEPLRCHEVNATGTLQILREAAAAGVKRVVYAASSAAYGNAPALPKVETMTPAPASPYAVSKLCGEMYTQIFCHLYRLPCVALRYFNVFGPYQDPTSAYSGVISRFADSIGRGVPPTILGPGTQSRDFVYIDDVVTATLQACQAAAPVGEVINIGSGQSTTLLDLVGCLNRAAGQTLSPQFLPARAGDVHASLADITKAKALLGYAPGVSLTEGLRRTLQHAAGAHV